MHFCMVTVLRSIELLPHLVKNVAQMTVQAQIQSHHLHAPYTERRNMVKEKKRTRTQSVCETPCKNFIFKCFRKDCFLIFPPQGEQRFSLFLTELNLEITMSLYSWVQFIHFFIFKLVSTHLCLGYRQTSLENNISLYFVSE